MTPDKIYLQRNTTTEWFEDTHHPNSDICYIRKDTLMEYLQKAYDTDKWFYDTHKKPDELHFGRCEAYRKVIEKIESL